MSIRDQKYWPEQGRSADPEFEHCKPDTQGTWQERCAALYQIIGMLSNHFGIFESSNDVADALDVAAGRGDVEKLLPWPKDITFGKPAAESENAKLKALLGETVKGLEEIDETLAGELPITALVKEKARTLLQRIKEGMK